MITPGAAGTLTMGIANALAGLFGQGQVGFLMLGLSFLVGLLVFGGPKMPRYKQAAFYIINSLIIFCVAAGVTATGSGIEQQASSGPLWHERTNFAVLDGIFPGAQAAEHARARRRPNGEKCSAASDCGSGNCYPGPQATGSTHLKYCIAKDMNCAVPGFDGARYGMRLRKNSEYYECLNPRNKQPAAFYSSTGSRFFKPLFKK